MEIENANFAYTASIKLSELPRCKAQTAFPGVSDLAVNSRNFTTYLECVNSAKGLMEDVAKDVTAQNKGQTFVVIAEVNPIHSGKETRSKDWNPEELARLWIFDKKEEGKKNIHAVGQARIFALERIEPAVPLN